MTVYSVNIMGFLDNCDNVVRLAVLDMKNEGAEISESDDFVIADLGSEKKCAFHCADGFFSYAKKHELSGTVCVMNMPLDASKVLGRACKTYAYLKPMPPTLIGKDIRRLAPTLAGVVFDKYNGAAVGYDIAEVEKLMRDKGVFGAIEDGKLAGFIGRHGDGNMGMLEVLDGYRRRGIGEELEKFLINYIMTFGRVPICEVYTDNAPSIALQNKLGLTPAVGYTFWMDGSKLLSKA